MRSGSARILSGTARLVRIRNPDRKKYHLPMPRRECVHPERRIGSGHGTYDDIILLNELPGYEAAWDRGFNEGLKGCLTSCS